MSNKEKEETPIGFVRRTARSALWNIRYHEIELPKAYAGLAFAKQLLERSNINESAEPIEYDDDEEPVLNTVEDFARSIIDRYQREVTYHEDRMQGAQAELGFLKIMLARGGYSKEEVDFDAIKALLDAEG